MHADNTVESSATNFHEWQEPQRSFLEYQADEKITYVVSGFWLNLSRQRQVRE